MGGVGSSDALGSFERAYDIGFKDHLSRERLRAVLDNIEHDVLDTIGRNTRKSLGLASGVKLDSDVIVAIAREKSLGLMGKTTVKDDKCRAPQINVKAGKLEFPGDVQKFCDSPFYGRIAIMCMYLGIPLESGPGTLAEPATILEKEFFEGYIKELCDTSEVSIITHNSKSQYANGRACARYEILKSLTKSTSQAYITNVHPLIEGERKKDGAKPLLTGVVNGNFSGKDLQADVCELFKNLARLAVTKPKLGLDKFKTNSKKFFWNFDMIAHSTKRHAKKTVAAKGKRGKPVEVIQPIVPTKPSLLKTVAEFERKAVAECFDTPWSALVDLKKDFESKGIFEVDFSATKLAAEKITNDQWHAKNQVMAATKQRLITYRNGRELTLQESLTATSEWLRSVKTRDSWIDEIVSEEKAVCVLAPFPKTLGDTTYTSGSAAITANRDRYPHAAVLLEDFGIYEDRSGRGRRGLDTSHEGMAGRSDRPPSQTDQCDEDMEYDHDLAASSGQLRGPQRGRGDPSSVGRGRSTTGRRR